VVGEGVGVLCLLAGGGRRCCLRLCVCAVAMPALTIKAKNIKAVIRLASFIFAFPYPVTVQPLS
jgi:hypothetical protein